MAPYEKMATQNQLTLDQVVASRDGGYALKAILIKQVQVQEPVQKAPVADLLAFN